MHSSASRTSLEKAVIRELLSANSRSSPERCHQSPAGGGREGRVLPSPTRPALPSAPLQRTRKTSVDLYEYQARDLFESYGVPVLAGIVADTPAEARAAAEKLGGTVVVKAQVKTGGRGKAGGVKVAHSPAEAEAAAEAILGLDIKGHVVRRVMVAAGARIAREFYFSVLLDRANRSYLSLVSVEGGMEIEELAVTRPEALARVEVDPIDGVDATRAAEIARAAGFPDDLVDRVATVIERLWTVYRDEDATLVEVNPLVLTESGEVIALDGKVTLDGNPAFRTRGT